MPDWYPVRGVDYCIARDIETLTAELVGLRLELARLKAPPAPRQDFPMRALNRRTQAIGLITRWQP